MPTVDARRTALLLMDFQNGIVTGRPGAEELVERAVKARRTAREAGAKVVYVRVAFTPQDFAAISPLNKTFSAYSGGGRMIEGTPEAAIVPELAPQDRDVVVTKTRVGAFGTTNLARYVSPREIDTLVLAGISTSGVVLSTLRDAADRDYRLCVLQDCCWDRPEVHDTLMTHVFPRQADVIDTDDLATLLG